MRRSLLALLLFLGACLALSAAALATGPGGWNHLGGTGLRAQRPRHRPERRHAGRALPRRELHQRRRDRRRGPDRRRGTARSWRALGTTPLGQRIGLRDRDPRRQGLRGRHLRQRRRQGAADYLAVYDGVSWKPFCNTTANPAFNAAGLQVRALQVIGSTLYVGGTFQNANGGQARRLPDRLRPRHRDAEPHGRHRRRLHRSDLRAGGHERRDALRRRHVHEPRPACRPPTASPSYNGSWHGLGTTAIGGIVRGLHAKGMNVYISSDGLNIGGIAQADHLVKWNGSAYSAVGANGAGTNGYFPATTYINALDDVRIAPVRGRVVAERRRQADGRRRRVLRAAGQWRPVGSNGAGGGPWVGEAQALAVFGGRLYAGGAFTGAGGDEKANFAASRSAAAAVVRPAARSALSALPTPRSASSIRRQRRLQRHWRRPDFRCLRDVYIF